MTGYNLYRRPTRRVAVGNRAVGGTEPILIQSMTNTVTADVESTALQIQRMEQAGCQMARVTVPTRRDADALPEIRSALKRLGVTIPLVADIHFQPALALLAARHVDKVRINPGNFGERTDIVTDLSSDEYNRELQQVSERMEPLIRILQKEGHALRIGTNHGSLSSRVLNRFGNTPRGMVESAIEYIQVAAGFGFHDIVVSMKSSLPRIMVEAYRLLVDRMDELGMDYPLHLGVTEAGQGNEGVIRSAVGIGALLLDGIGDTIRVSLTDPPENEIAPAQELVECANRATGVRRGQWGRPRGDQPFQRRHSARLPITPGLVLGAEAMLPVGATTSHENEPEPEFTLDGSAGVRLGYCERPENRRRLRRVAQGSISDDDVVVEWLFDPKQLETDIELFRSWNLPAERHLIALAGKPSLHHLRRLTRALPMYPLDLIHENGQEASSVDLAMHAGALLLDGVGDALTLLGNYPEQNATRLALDILQGAGRRVWRTEFISCPSCGRTLFDLESTTRKVREATQHLVGLKIAVMGCIVNGPGEMADADFGYVGSGHGKVHLYRRQNIVRHHISEADAIPALIDLIRDEGFWQDPDN